MTKSKALLFACGIVFSLGCRAEYVASTGWATISKISASETVTFDIQGAALCQTTVFTIDTRDLGGKEQLATILAAASAGKTVFLETWVGCPSASVPSQNWGMKVGRISVKY